MSKLKMILPLVFFTSCSGGGGFSSDYFPLLLETPKRVINSFKPYTPGDDYIQNQKTSFVTVELGAQNATLVLQSIDNNVFTWIGLDNVVLKTYKGFIISTVGLEHNLEIIDPLSNIDKLLINESDILVYTFDHPKLYELPISVNYINQSSQIIELDLVSDDINWHSKIKIEYEQNGLPSSSMQSSHPFLKPLRLRFYYKY